MTCSSAHFKSRPPIILKRNPSGHPSPDTAVREVSTMALSPEIQPETSPTFRVWKEKKGKQRRNSSVINLCCGVIKETPSSDSGLRWRPRSILLVCSTSMASCTVLIWFSSRIFDIQTVPQKPNLPLSRAESKCPDFLTLSDLSPHVGTLQTL